MCSSSFTKCKFNVKHSTTKILDSRIVHPEKLVFSSTMCMEYFGFITNSEDMTIS